MQENKNEPLPREEARKFILDTVKIIAVSLAIIVPIRYYLIQPFFVKGASMEPTFENNDYILIDEISYRFNEPQRGEVIVFRSPENNSQFFIKRIAGLPGETVQIADGKVIIFNEQNPDGLILEEPYLDPQQRTSGSLIEKLDNDEYFVLGDNRMQSSDSRKWGALNRSLITGKALFRVWPFSKISKF